MVSKKAASLYLRSSCGREHASANEVSTDDVCKLQKKVSYPTCLQTTLLRMQELGMAHAEQQNLP